jgi:conjugative relaxase-like TrwC/TraI family protein
MLSISAMSGGQAGYYLSLAREDYYLEGGEPPGRWYGEGAAVLGLANEVQPDQLYNLFDGLSPDGSVSLIQKQNHEDKAEHRPGWDLTFSAPKSVSALWSQLDQEGRTVIQEAHFEAAARAIDYLQDVAGFTRRGKGGTRMERASFIIASFEHSTSRALDPQLHSHFLLLNVGVRQDGTTGTLSSLKLFQEKMAAGALYRLHLSAILERELGISTYRKQKWFEAAGVSETLITEFSKRREAIEKELDKRGLHSAEAAAAAAIRTRDAKEGVSRKELFTDWVEVGMKHGWSRAEAESLFGRSTRRPDLQLEFKAAIALATERLTSSQAHFTERDFIRSLAEEAQCSGIYTPELLEKARDHLSGSHEIVRLGRHYGEHRFTTVKMIQLEESLFAAVEFLNHQEKHRSDQSTAVQVLGEQHSLSEEQLNAVWQVTAGSSGFASVSGMAGTGKTRMLEAAKAVWNQEGRQVYGTALAARAVKELEAGSGIESQTIANLLHKAQSKGFSLEKSSVLVVDEAGMIATPDLEKIAHLCYERGVKLVLIGDERQLQPIGPGAPFMELGKRYGQAELKEIRRQNDAWARKAVKDLAEGRAQEALQAFVQKGLVKVSETKEEAMRMLVTDWLQEARPLKSTLLLAGTRAEADSLNLLAQEARQKRGDLGRLEVSISGRSFCLNDRVMFTKRYAALGVVNGDRGFLHAYDRGSETVTVLLDSGEKVSFEREAMQHIDFGYASTTHKGQGATTLRTYVLAGGSMQDREMSYVQASRAREQTTFYLTRLETGDEMARLAKEMERSRAKEMAHTVLRSQSPTPPRRERAPDR